MLLENRFTLLNSPFDRLLNTVCDILKAHPSHAVTPHWLMHPIRVEQTAWLLLLANEISAADAGSKAAVLKNYLAVRGNWILNGSSIECHEKKHQPFSLSCVRFGSRVIQISGWKSAWHWRSPFSKLSGSEPLWFHLQNTYLQCTVYYFQCTLTTYLTNISLLHTTYCNVNVFLFN